MKHLVYSEVMNEAWVSVKDDLALVIGLTAVMGFGIWVFSLVPYAGYFLTGALSVGYCRALLQIQKKQTIGYQDIFWGFQNLNRFLHYLVLNVVMSIGMIFGFFLFVAPGVWFAVAASLATPLFVQGTEDGIEAIKKSMELVRGRWWNIAGFCGILFLLIMAGAMFFGIGLLLAMPLAAMAGLIAVQKLTVPPTVSSATTEEPSTTTSSESANAEAPEVVPSPS